MLNIKDKKIVREKNKFNCKSRKIRFLVDLMRVVMGFKTIGIVCW